VSTDEPLVARTLLVVDDDDVFRSRLARAFVERGYDVRQARDGEEARRLAEHETPEFAVVDLRMPGGSGLEVNFAIEQLEHYIRG
jgi:two-component system response regulator RegA